MLLEVVAVIAGLALLVWSADRFVDGAAASAAHLGLSPLLIGMLVIGLGTSAPEVVVSTLSSLQGNPGLALGNAYGSNIANIALILGVTALLSPITVKSRVLRRELPLLAGATALAWVLIADGHFSRLDAWLQFAAFGLFLGWSLWQERRAGADALGEEAAAEIPDMSMRRGLLWVLVGLLVLVASSRLVVWGAVGLAQAAGVSDLVIGLTVVAVGTSLPELAAAVAAVRKGEHDLALGNVIGSNMFNTLLVAALAGAIAPHAVEPALLGRDLPVLAALTAALFAMGIGVGGGAGRINRIEGTLLVLAFGLYTGWLVIGALVPAAGAAG